MFMETARALAMKTLAKGGVDDDQPHHLRLPPLRCAQAEPKRRSAELQRLLDKERQRYADGKLNPWDLVADDPAHPPALPEGASPAEAAAWTIVSRVMLNLDETITKE